MNIDIPITREDEISQIPALQLLQNIGWKYLTPEEGLLERRGIARNVILEDVLERQLRKINSFYYKDQKFDFSESNIANAITSLREVPYEGLIKTSEKILDLLLLGKSYNENVRGDVKSYDFRYIDWERPENNEYHVTEEFSVEKMLSSGEYRRPDIVCFVNGIPFIIIECKRSDIKNPIVEAVEQQIRNFKNDEIPNLYTYAQLLLGMAPLTLQDSKQLCLYATVGTPKSYWFPWRERDLNENELERLINTRLNIKEKDRLFSDRFKNVRSYFEELEKNPRIRTQQDEIIYSLCRPERLLELVKKFILFDGGQKKIARYQQYYSVKSTLRKISNVPEGTKRPSGVIWHTQGSGKSLSMVMLAKSIAMEPGILNPKIVLLTDRIQLDGQISRTFNNCGVPLVQAKTGNHLSDLLQSSKANIISTVIDKFETVANSKELIIESTEIFILVDEAHRTQYGESNSKVQKVLPNACFIAYTGTPLTKRNKKNTMAKFGAFYDTPYTVRDALADKAVVPLLYEGRVIPQDVNQDLIDRWLDRVTRPLSEDQKADLKKKFNSMNHLAKTNQRIFMAASDVSEHYRQNWKGTGLKALLAVDSVKSAFKYKEFLDELGEVTSEIIISSPDTRKGHSDLDEDDPPPVKFSKMIKERFGSIKDYETSVYEKFDSKEGPDILIVVWKLLTGFDVQRCSVLYLDKNLESHTLLQAIARVNRCFDGKDYGYIIDYHGNLKNLRDAIKHYDKLAFEKKYGDSYDDSEIKEINDAIHDISEISEKLEKTNEELWNLFKNVKNKRDAKEYEKILFERPERENFYERLTTFATTFQSALNSAEYYSQTPIEKIQKYKSEVRFFKVLRESIGRMFSETVDYKEYSPRIEKLLNTHVAANEAKVITKMFEIYEKSFDSELEEMDTRSKALTILHRTKKYIVDNMEKDRVFYERFSKLLQKTLDDYLKGRISERDFLASAEEFRQEVQFRTKEDLPEVLNNNTDAMAYYGILLEAFKDKIANQKSKNNDFAEIAVRFDEIIKKNIVVDWIKNINIQNRIKGEIEDYIFEIKDEKGIVFDYDLIDFILENIIKTAKSRNLK